MTRLLSADQMRLRKAWLFWIMLAAAALLTVPPFREALSEAGRIGDPSEGWAIDAALFQATMVHGVSLAAFIPLFLGADYHDGTIRNKLIAGHSRSSVYFSALGVCAITVLSLTAASAAGYALQAVAAHGIIGTDTPHFVLCVFSSVCCAMAFGSLYVVLSMLIDNRAYAILACIGVLFAMVFVTGRLEHALLQAEIARDVVDFVDGRPVWSEPYPNPAYVGGLKRAAYEWIIDFLPTGQGTLLSNMGADRVSRFPMLSALFIVLTSSIGLLGFRSKDIK